MNTEIKTAPSFLGEDAARKQREREDRAIRKALKIVNARMRSSSDVISSPNSLRAYIKLSIGPCPDEHFMAIFLNNRHAVIETEIIFRGSVTSANVPPRPIVRMALEHNAAAVIFAHNHPSGGAEPSQDDIRITEKLKKALALIDVSVLDHVIIGHEITSMAEKGLM